MKKDSLVAGIKKIVSWQEDTAFTRFFFNKKLPKNKQSVYAINAVRQPTHEDEQFYILAGLLFFTGVVRALFPKYFTTLFQLFFQSSQRQRQLKENMAQDALPSFLMNLVFIFSGGFLLTAFIKGDDFFSYHIAFPVLWIYACAALAIIYIAKSFFIMLFGWSFDAQEPASDYRFIVFIVNKMAGLCFLPLLIITYSNGAGFSIVATITIVIISILLIYRYIVSLSLIGKKLKIHPLHFFLYLCAVEILPLLITYKVLLITKEL